MTGLVAYAVHSVVTGLTNAPVPDCSQSILATWRSVSIETSSGPLPSRIEPLGMIFVFTGSRSVDLQTQTPSF